MKLSSVCRGLGAGSIGATVIAAAAFAPAYASDPEVSVPEPPQSAPLHVVIDTEKHRLSVVSAAGDTVFAAPVATGRNAGFEYEGRFFHFATPRGRRTVLAKKRDPVWTVPEWHYYEKAVERGLEPVHLVEATAIPLSDGTLLTMKDGRPGRVNKAGHFVPFPIGIEIIFDDRIFIPPLSSPHRKVPGALGPFSLDLGDGYLIHGTNRYTANSIGESISHGCIRMSNDDLARVFELVPVGAVVYIG